MRERERGKNPEKLAQPASGLGSQGGSSRGAPPPRAGSETADRGAGDGRQRGRTCLAQRAERVRGQSGPGRHHSKVTRRAPALCFQLLAGGGAEGGASYLPGVELPQSLLMVGLRLASEGPAAVVVPVVVVVTWWQAETQCR